MPTNLLRGGQDGPDEKAIDRVIPVKSPITTPYPGTELYKEFRKSIINKFGNEEKYIEGLGDASEFLINLTDYYDESLFELKNDLEKELGNVSFTGLPEILWYRYK